MHLTAKQNLMKNNFIIPIFITWVLTSIVKTPAFLSLTAAYAYIFFSQSSKQIYSKKIILSFIISSLSLAYCLNWKIYTANISVLISAGIGLFFIEGHIVGNFKTYISDIFHQAIKNEKISTLIFLICLLAIFLGGSFFALKVGLSWDEAMEQKTFEKALDAISNGLKGDTGYYLINNWQDKYYGIGFYFPFYLIHKPFVNFISELVNVSAVDAILLSRHLAVFWLFVFSSLFVAGIVYFLVKSKKYAYLIAIAYLTWPYALGHGMTNVKDSPFASVWIICSFFIIKIIADYFDQHKIRSSTLLALTCSVGWLLGIRISGILIFIPILIAAIFLVMDRFYGNFRATKNSISAVLITLQSIKNQISVVLPYCGLIIIFVLISYPVIWQDPSEFMRAVQYMSRHPWNGCTLTNGECMQGQNLPYSYIPLWLLVKEPVAVLFGFLTIPFVFIKLLSKKHFQSLILLSTLIFPVFLIYTLIVAKSVVLYDEIRQVLFMAEIIFIVGAVAIFILSARVGFVVILFSVILFSIDNLKIYPYQVSWFNEISRFTTINDKFETDYWGNVLARLAMHANNNPYDLKGIKCAYGNPNHLFAPYLDKQKYNCDTGEGAIPKIENLPRPSLYARYARDRSALPDTCSYVHKESITLTLTSQPIYLGELILCK